MQFTEAVKIVEALAEGYDPDTGECLPADNACQRPDVIRALYLVVQKVKHPAGLPPAALANAAKPWTAAEEAGPARAYESGVTVARLAQMGRHAVRALPERQRQAVLLRYAADLSYVEVGAVMGVSEVAARQHASTGVRSLRKGELDGHDD